LASVFATESEVTLAYSYVRELRTEVTKWFCSIAPHELAQALGEERVIWLIQETALPRDELLAGLGRLLPELVDKLTPDGRIPTE